MIAIYYCCVRAGVNESRYLCGHEPSLKLGVRVNEERGSKRGFEKRGVGILTLGEGSKM